MIFYMYMSRRYVHELTLDPRGPVEEENRTTKESQLNLINDEYLSSWYQHIIQYRRHCRITVHSYYFSFVSTLVSNHLCVLRNFFRGILVIKGKKTSSLRFHFPSRRKKITRFYDPFFFSSNYVTTHNGDTTY